MLMIVSHFLCKNLSVLNFLQIEKIGGPISQPQKLDGINIIHFFRGFLGITWKNLLFLGNEIILSFGIT